MLVCALVFAFGCYHKLKRFYCFLCWHTEHVRGYLLLMQCINNLLMLTVSRFYNSVHLMVM